VFLNRTPPGIVAARTARSTMRSADGVFIANHRSLLGDIASSAGTPEAGLRRQRRQAHLDCRIERANGVASCGRFRPSLRHPSNGKAGDPFVDSTHRLWSCQSGTTWKQLA